MTALPGAGALVLWGWALYPDTEPWGIAGGTSGVSWKNQKHAQGTGRNCCWISGRETFVAITRRAGWLTVGTGVEPGADLSKGNARHTREGGRGGHCTHQTPPGRAHEAAGQPRHHPQWGKAEIPAQPCSQSRGMHGVPSHTRQTGARTAAVTFGDKNTHLFIFMHIHQHTKDTSTCKQTEHQSEHIPGTDEAPGCQVCAALPSPSPSGASSPPALPAGPARAGRGAGAGPPDSSVCGSVWQTEKKKKRTNPMFILSPLENQDSVLNSSQPTKIVSFL